METHTLGPESSQKPEQEAQDALAMSGLRGLIAATRRYMAEEQGNASATIRRLSEDFAHIQLGDIRNPIKFLRQMEGHPPIRLGTHGFRREVVDDTNPARHYMAFVAMGYWLPYWMAIGVLYLWEVAGYIRYGFKWSEADLLSGLLGVRHGNVVRRGGLDALPGLMAADLATADLAGSLADEAGESSV